MDVRRAASGQACKSSSCKCHGGGGRLGLPAERRKGAVVQRRGGLTGTRGPGFLARLTQSGHFSRHPFPGKQMSFLPCGAWERPGSGMTGGGTPARGTPGDLRCPGDSPPPTPECRRKDRGRRKTPWAPAPFSTLPRHVVISEASGPGNGRASTGRALGSRGRHCPHPM